MWWARFFVRNQTTRNINESIKENIQEIDTLFWIAFIGMNFKQVQKSISELNLIRFKAIGLKVQTIGGTGIVKKNVLMRLCLDGF